MTSSLKFSQKILLAASVVIVTCLGLFTLYNDYRKRVEISTSLQSDLRDQGQILAQSIENWLSGRLLLVEGMAQTMALDDSAERLQAILQQSVMTKTYVAGYVGKADGTFVIYPDRTMPEGFDARQRPWYQSALSDGSILTEPYIGAGTDYLVITQAAPIRQGGRTLGALGVNLNLDAMAKMVNALNLDGMGYAFLVSKDGKILVHPDKQWVTKPLGELFNGNAPALDKGLIDARDVDSERLVMFLPVQGLPSVDWYVGLSVDKAKAYAPLTEFRTSAVLATVLAVIITLAVLGLLIRMLLRPLRTTGSAMKNIAEGEGDLTQRLVVGTGDEFGMLAQAFNRFIERIHGSIGEVATTAANVGEVAHRVTDSSNSSMNKSDAQAGRTQSVASAILQLGSAAQEIAQNAASASQGASQARTKAQEAQGVVASTIQAMTGLSTSISSSREQIEALNDKSANIGRILEVIQSISEQTNLLALNAAIEAARAGEAGRGFAVVADEVRNLAHRTQTSAQEIHQMIEALQQGSRQAVATMSESQRSSDESVRIAQQAGEHLLGVTSLISDIDGMNQSVATATEEQTAVVDTLTREITEINTLNREGVENLQSTLRACKDLEAQSQALRHLVGTFRI